MTISFNLSPDCRFIVKLSHNQGYKRYNLQTDRPTLQLYLLQIEENEIPNNFLLKTQQ